MNAVEIIVTVSLALVVAAAVVYIVKEKRKGKKCIGCPYSSECMKCSCTPCKTNSKDTKKHE